MMTTCFSVRRFTRAGLLTAIGALAPVLVSGSLAAQGLSSPSPSASPSPSVDVQAPGPYRVARRIPIGGEGGWDYLNVDAAHHKLYVSHGTHVVVVDLERDTVVGDIPNTPGVHGIAIDPVDGRGFTSNGRDSTVTIFSLTDYHEIGRVNVGGANPDAITYDPFTKRVFTMNGRSESATAIDAATGQVVGHVDLGGRPEEVATDARGRLYINIESKSEIAEVDPRALTVLRRWSIMPCEGPSGIAIDVAHRRLFSVCDKVMAVSDLAAGKVLTTVPIGNGPDGAGFDAATGRAFSSNGEGTLSVVTLEKGARGTFTVVQTLPTERGARTMTVDPTTHVVYTATAEFGPPPAPTADRPRPRPTIVPGTFHVIVIEPVK